MRVLLRENTGLTDAYPYVRNFDKLILNAIDEILTVFGENAKQTIYQLIEEKFRVQRREIPERLQVFHEALTELFGTGAATIEKAILDRACEIRTLTEYEKLP